MTVDYNNTTTVFTNTSVSSSNVTSSDGFIEVCRILWLCGIFVSFTGLFTQLGFFYYIPSCRKYDEKILTLLSSARILTTVCEYCVVYITVNNIILKDILFAAYFQADFILVAWMFVFSKNLYDKIVLVFTNRRFGLIKITFILFFLSLPIGVVAVICLKIAVNNKSEHFNLFYITYDCFKFFVLIINALIFGKIIYIAYKKGSGNSKNVARYVKAAIISFILVCITSLQVFITDVCSLVLNYYLITYHNCVINSYQVVIITIMFVILARGKKTKHVNESSYTSNNASVRLNLESAEE